MSASRVISKKTVFGVFFGDRFDPDFVPFGNSNYDIRDQRKKLSRDTIFQNKINNCPTRDSNRRQLELNSNRQHAVRLRKSHGREILMESKSHGIKISYNTAPSENICKRRCGTDVVLRVRRRVRNLLSGSRWKIPGATRRHIAESLIVRFMAGRCASFLTGFVPAQPRQNQSGGSLRRVLKRLVESLIIQPCATVPIPQPSRSE